MTARSEKGFTLIEVVMSMIILLVGVTMISSLISDLSRKNFLSHNHTQAVLLAQNKIEELLDEGYNSDALIEGIYENPLNPVNSTADSSGVFYQFWEVEDVRPIPKSKQITSWVEFLDKDGAIQTVNH